MCKRVARGGERSDSKQWHEGLEGELHGFPWLVLWTVIDEAGVRGVNAVLESVSWQLRPCNCSLGLARIRRGRVLMPERCHHDQMAVL